MKTLLLITLLSLTIISTNTQAADEGIKVHGHWKFEIYNPDGSFDRKVSFDNAFNIGAGSSPLLFILSRKSSMVSWLITLEAPNGMEACANASGTPYICYIVEPGANVIGGSNYFTNLSISLSDASNSSNPLSPTKLILNGSFTTGTVIANPQITKVTTNVDYCTPAVVPTTSSCSGSGSQLDSVQFTSKSLATPLTLTPGQFVQVVVEISFS